MMFALPFKQVSRSGRCVCPHLHQNVNTRREEMTQVFI